MKTGLFSMKRSGVSIAVVLCALLACAAPASAQQTPAASADAEVRALIAALGQSGCRFQRNGRWHDATEAQSHLQRKYDVARKRGREGTAEDFIEAAASRSMLSGKAYRVVCPGQAERDAGEWFRDQLSLTRRHRSAR